MARQRWSVTLGAGEHSVEPKHRLRTGKGVVGVDGAVAHASRSLVEFHDATIAFPFPYTRRAMEILPNVHAVKLLASTAFLIAEDQLTLIDAGLRGSGRLLRTYLDRINREQRELTRIICTHAHPDHVGGVRELVTSPEVEVLMHPADRARLKITWRDVLARPSAGPLVMLLTRGPEDARPVRDGEVLPVLGGLEVVHTPGHTPGSICLYARERRVLFVGDVLQVIRGKLSLPSHVFSEDLGLAARSIARLAELEVDVICFAHFPAWRVNAREALRELAEAS